LNFLFFDHLPVIGIELAHAQWRTMDDMNALTMRIEDFLWSNNRITIKECIHA